MIAIIRFIEEEEQRSRTELQFISSDKNPLRISKSSLKVTCRFYRRVWYGDNQRHLMSVSRSFKIDLYGLLASSLLIIRMLPRLHRHHPPARRGTSSRLRILQG
jgi:hypothetical protein